MRARSLLNRKFLKSFLRVTRTGNLFIIAFAQYFTACFLVGWETIRDPRLFLLSVSTVLIAAAGYIINDYYDIKIDFINKPDRVEIGKTITRRFAILFHISFSMLGILIGFYLSLVICAINIVSVFLLWFYSNSLKRQPFIGNFTVALLTGLSVFIVDMLYPPYHSLVLIYASFAFFMTLVREIIKDMEDLKGDDTFGCRTLPIVIGLRKTKIVIYIVLGLFVLTVILLDQFYARLNLHYLIFILFIPLLYFIWRLYRADMKKDFTWLSSFCKYILLLGILSMALT